MPGRARAMLLTSACAIVAAAPIAGCGHDPRPRVKNVILRGVKNLGAREIKKRLVTQEEHWYTPTRRRHLSPSTLEQDLKRVEAYYASRGYFGARVAKCDVRPRRGNNVDVILTIEEGVATRVARVDVRGLEPLGADGARLASELTVRPGSVFDHERYLVDKDTLLHRLRERGHAWAQVEGSVEVDRDRREAVLVLAADPGPVVTIGAVSVEGTNRISAPLVLREADIPPGRRFSPDILEVARGRLHNLGVFSSVRVEPRRDPVHPDVARIVVAVTEEARLRTLRLGLGLGIESQRTEVHGRFSLGWNNFLGGLRRFELKLDVGYVAIPAFWNPERQGPQASLSASLTQPHFPWRRAKTRLSVGYDVGIEYGFRFHGPRAEVGVSWPLLDNHIRFGVSYGFQFLDFFDVEPGILEDPLKAGQLYGYRDPYRLSWLQEQITFDWRDHPFGTHKGWLLEFTFEQGGPWTGSAFFYESFVADARGYVPLGGRVVFAARLEFGHIFSHGEFDSPITRRLYAGGPSSHRGFNYHRLSLQIPSGDPGVPPIPIGGDQLLLGQAELRVNLFQLWGSWVAAAAFFDAGDVADPKKLIDLRRLHYAVGGGLRYNTVVGAIRFDLGVRLNRLDPTESDGRVNPDPGERFAFHISIGEAF